MCGICGVVTRSGEQPSGDLLRAMARTLVHRGPDDEGFLIEPGIGFGFRRLSIIDVSGGHQPVYNERRDVAAIVNGEIYNYVELRHQLEQQGHLFRSESDSETIVHAYEQYGLDFVDKLRGMFALAVWDQAARKLVLARDRIGKKPLYYAERDGQLAFASEIKALLPWPRLHPEVHVPALSDYLTLLYIPSPQSILKGVHKLPPGHLLTVTRDAVKETNYGRFRLPERPLEIPLEEAQEQLDERLLEATRIRLRSDVPLGAFLSGGLDSSAVVSYMERASSGEATRTYSMGFEEATFDERSYARSVAEALGTQHHEELVTPVSEAFLLDLIWYLDEPFSDASAIPTYLVSRIARQHVTVVLSGDGGDELFGGYNRYVALDQIQRLARFAPGWLRKLGHSASKGAYGALPEGMSRHFEWLRLAVLASKIATLPPAARFARIDRYYTDEEKRSLLGPDALAGFEPQTESWLTETVARIGCGDPISAYMHTDTLFRLPDDILTKVDRTSMANGLEVRCPLLDQEVVEFVLSLPREFKLHRGRRKLLLKRLVRDRLPPQIMRRRKMGFGVPYGPWLAGTFRSLVEDCLSPESLRKRGIFSVAPVVELRDSVLRYPTGARGRITEHQRWHRVWMVLMFELWARRFLDGTGQALPVDSR